MEKTEIQPLINNYHNRLATVSNKYHRYLYSQINWDARMIGIKGARGVGKTTLILQHIIENHPNVDDVLYASLDDLWFANHSVMDLVDWVWIQGIKRLYLDEVHRCPNWSLILKNIYDTYSEISIVYTSSSLLSIDNASVDLSRRQTLYTMRGLSFREFLEFEGVTSLKPIGLGELPENHVGIALRIVRETRIIPLFNDYLEHGFYPFYRTDGKDYLIKLGEIINVTIESDLPAVEDVSYETISKVRKLLMIISGQVPFVPNLSILWRELSINNTQGLKMLYALDRAMILGLATGNIKNYKHLSKPDKVYLNNTNLMHALCGSVNKGGERETFFFNQISAVADVNIPQHGDFLVNGQYLFEIGGKTKSFDQIKDVPDSFLAVDDTEIGSSNRIPLWMFGLLY